MAIRFYDEALYNKIQSWIPDDTMRILKPDETSRLFSIRADLKNDKPLTLPIIALSRESDIDVSVNTKRSLSFDGNILNSKEDGDIIQLNAIPISLYYNIDIYTKKFVECDEYVRELVFKLINNPKLTISLPYNGVNIEHNANIRVGSTISDNSDIPEKLFSDQFTRFTIRIELQDAYLFSIPFNYKTKIKGIEFEYKDREKDGEDIYEKEKVL